MKADYTVEKKTLLERVVVLCQLHDEMGPLHIRCLARREIESLLMDDS
jgi:hypothetical protein